MAAHQWDRDHEAWEWHAGHQGIRCSVCNATFVVPRGQFPTGDCPGVQMNDEILDPRMRRSK